MIKIKLSALEVLKNSGYEVIEEGENVVIRFNPPSIREAMSSDEGAYEEINRKIEIIGMKGKDEVIILDAYVMEGNSKKRKLDLSELELWAEYINEL